MCIGTTHYILYSIMYINNAYIYIQLLMCISILRADDYYIMLHHRNNLAEIINLNTHLCNTAEAEPLLLYRDHSDL